MRTNFTDILLWTAKALKTNFPSNNIYVDLNEQVISVPSFYIEVIPMNVKEGFDSMRYKMVNIIIEYIDRTARKEKRLQVIDDLTEIMGRGLLVSQEDGTMRTLPIFDKKPTITKDASVLLVTMQYFDGHKNPAKPEEDDRYYDDLMEILALNVQAKEQ
jgi:hypothetical protein